MIKRLKHAGEARGQAALVSIMVLVWPACAGSTALQNATAANDRVAIIERLHQADARLAAIAYRLQTRNAPLCGSVAGQTGLIVHDLAQYGPPFREAVRRALALDEREAIAVVVPGSAAYAAGLRAGDPIEAVDGVAIGRQPILPVTPSSDGVDRLDMRLAQAADTGPVALRVDRKGQTVTATIAPVPGCRARIRLVPGSHVDAVADDYSINISTALIDFTASDDELALAVGHELAHVVLRHRARLAAARVDEGLGRLLPRNAARLRATEREADYLGLYLMARAGYDIHVAPAFWLRFGKTHGAGMFGDGSHPGERSRAGALALEIDEIEAKRRAGEPLLPDGVVLPRPPTRPAISDTNPRSAAPPR